MFWSPGTRNGSSRSVDSKSAWVKCWGGQAQKERLIGGEKGEPNETLRYAGTIETYRCRRIGGKISGRLLASSLRLTREAVKQLSTYTTAHKKRLIGAQGKPHKALSLGSVGRTE